MGTEVLYPQDILCERFRVCQPVFHGRKSFFVNGSGFGNVKSNNYGYRKQLNHLSERLDTKRKSTTVQPSINQQLISTPRRTVVIDLENHLNSTPRRTVVDLENHHLNRSSNHQYQQQQQLQNHLNSTSRRTVVDLENYDLYRSSNHQQQQQLQNHLNSTSRRSVVDLENYDLYRSSNHQQQQQLHNHLNSNPRRSVVDFENHHLNRFSNHQQQLQNRVEIGQVTVLRRGRSLDSLEAQRKKKSNIKTKEEISITDKLNLECGYGNSLYAGTAFHSSPAPESLPLPSFFSIKDNKDKNSKKDKYDASASRDLRRLLRLE